MYVLMIQTHKRFNRTLFIRIKTQSSNFGGNPRILQIVIFSFNKQHSVQPFMCLDFVLEHKQSLFQILYVIMSLDEVCMGSDLFKRS